MRRLATFFAKLKKDRTPVPVITGEDEENRDVLEAASREAHEALYEAGVPVQIGYEEIFASMKQKILREKYGIEWKP